METKSENLPNNSKKNLNNIRIQAPVQGMYVIHMSKLEKEMSTFDLDLMHIEIYHSCKMKIRHIQNIILICITMSNKILLIKEKQVMSFKKKVEQNCNTSLAKYLVLMHTFTHFHFSTKLCKHFLYPLWDRLTISRIANMLNTQTLR